MFCDGNKNTEEKTTLNSLGPVSLPRWSRVPVPRGKASPPDAQRHWYPTCPGRHLSWLHLLSRGLSGPSSTLAGSHTRHPADSVLFPAQGHQFSQPLLMAQHLHLIHLPSHCAAISGRTPASPLLFALSTHHSVDKKPSATWQPDAVLLPHVSDLMKQFCSNDNFKGKVSQSHNKVSLPTNKGSKSTIF